MMNIYFVYSYTDPRNNEIFYVGMGKGARHFSHIKEAKLYHNGMKNRNIEKIKRIVSILNDDLSPVIKIIDDNLDIDTAADLERFLISFIGRKIKGDGCLLNLAPGGKSGWPMLTKERRERIYGQTFGNPEKKSKMMSKARQTCEQRYGVSSYSKTAEFKDNARHVFEKLYESGSHWIQMNREKISENTRRQAENGRHPFQTPEYRERKRKECQQKNTEMNRVKSERENVATLKLLYTQHQLKQPRGGIWVKQDSWINSEIERLTNNPFGDL